MQTHNDELRQLQQTGQCRVGLLSARLWDAVCVRRSTTSEGRAAEREKRAEKQVEQVGLGKDRLIEEEKVEIGKVSTMAD